MAVNTIKKATSSAVTLATATNNQVATVTGTDALTGESNLTFDGTDLAIGNAAPSSYIDSVHGIIVGDTGDATSEIVIVTSTSGVGEINFTDTADTTNQASISHSHSTNALTYDCISGLHEFEFAGSTQIRLDQAKVFVFESANANQAIGVTINQATADDEILAFKSSDIAHGMTDYAETDTYGFISKNINNSADGGLWLASFGDGADGGTLQSNTGSNPDTAKTTGAGGSWRVRAAIKSGTGITDCGANTNLMTIVNNGTTRFIFDADGDSHQDVGTAWTNFDAYDDAQLTRSLGIALSPQSAIQTRWDDWGRDHHALIEEVGLVPKLTEEQKARGERGLVNMTLLQRIHNGAIWQLHTETQDIKEMVAMTRNDFQAAIEARDAEIRELRNEMKLLKGRK